MNQRTKTQIATVLREIESQQTQLEMIAEIVDKDIADALAKDTTFGQLLGDFDMEICPKGGWQ